MKILPAEGIEPTLPCGNQILSLARLPVPPHRLQVVHYSLRPSWVKHRNPRIIFEGERPRSSHTIMYVVALSEIMGRREGPGTSEAVYKFAVDRFADFAVLRVPLPVEWVRRARVKQYTVCRRRRTQL